MRDFSLSLQVAGISRAACTAAIEPHNEGPEGDAWCVVAVDWRHKILPGGDSSIARVVAVDWRVEIASPVLPGGDRFEASIARVVAVTRALAAAGAEVSPRCTFRVRVDVGDFSRRAVTVLVHRLACLGGEFDAIMPPARRGRGGVHDAYHAAGGEAIASSAIKDNVDVMLFRALLSSRPGTVDFRQHGGTVDARKVEAWIRLVTSFVDESAARAALIDSGARPASLESALRPVAVPAPLRRRSGIRCGGPTKLQILTDALTGAAGNGGLSVSYLQDLTGWASPSSVHHGLERIAGHGYEIHRGQASSGRVSYWATPRDAAAEAAVLPGGTDSIFVGVPDHVRRFYTARAARFAARAAQAAE